jgi:hypothetical protein
MPVLYFILTEKKILHLSFAAPMLRFPFCRSFLLLISSPSPSTTLASEVYAEESPTWKIGDDLWKGIEPFKFESVANCLSNPWDHGSEFYHDSLQVTDPFHVVQEKHYQTCGDMGEFFVQLIRHLVEFQPRNICFQVSTSRKGNVLTFKPLGSALQPTGKYPNKIILTVDQLI